MRTFTVAELEARYGIARRLVTDLIRNGYVSPTRGARREYRFSFHDVVILRMAQDLVTAGIPAARAARFLGSLKRALPVAPAAGMRVMAAGRDLVVRQDGRLRNEDGQLVIDFMHAAADAPPVPSTTLARHHLARADADDSATRGAASPSAADTEADARRLFTRAVAHESRDPAAALRDYREAIALQPDYTDAWLNLGVLLLNQRRLHDAVALHAAAIAACAPSATLHFNYGVALEESGELPRALEEYETAVRLDRSFSDAWYNAGRLHEVLGEKKAAIRCFSQYRRLGGDG